MLSNEFLYFLGVHVLFCAFFFACAFRTPGLALLLRVPYVPVVCTVRACCMVRSLCIFLYFYFFIFVCCVLWVWLCGSLMAHSVAALFGGRRRCGIGQGGSETGR